MISFILLFSFHSFISIENRFLKVCMVANQKHNKLQTYIITKSLTGFTESFLKAELYISSDLKWPVPRSKGDFDAI